MTDGQSYLLVGLASALSGAAGWFFKVLHKRAEVAKTRVELEQKREDGAWSQVAKLWEFSAVQEREIADLRKQLMQSVQQRQADHDKIIEQDAKIIEQGKQIESLQSEVDDLLIKGGAPPKYRKSEMQVRT